MYVRPIPATAKANYLKVYEVVPEAAALADTGLYMSPASPQDDSLLGGGTCRYISRGQPLYFLALYEKVKSRCSRFTRRSSTRPRSSSTQVIGTEANWTFVSVLSRT